MDCSTNELRMFKENEEIPERFEPLPEELQNAAKKKLRGRSSCIVSKTSGGKISRWAASKRKKQKQTQKKVKACNDYYQKLQAAEAR